MTQYNTKQRQLLLDYLADHPDETLSAKQIAAALADAKISVSAVYRNLAALEQANLLKRSSKAGSREMFYQYIDAPECRECLHLSCTKCGKTFHMQSDHAAQLIKSIADDEAFMLDKSDTVLYGICKQCQV